jgi:P27 family predicted phage terminase small subunit
MGRHELDDNTRWLQGNRASQAKAPADSTIRGGKPSCPKDLDDVERAAWKEIVKWLSPRRTLTKADGPLLRLYAENSARHRALLKELKEHGEIITQTVLDSSGNAHEKRVLNPAARAASTVAATLQRLLRELSATPATREKTRPAARPAPAKSALVEGSREWLEREIANEAEESEAESEAESETETQEETNEESFNEI